MTTERKRVHFPDTFNPKQAPVHTLNTLIVSQPRERIWQALIDARNWDKHYTHCKNITLTHHTLQSGSEFQWTWTDFMVRAHCRIVEFEPYARLAWEGTGWGARGYHGWVLEDQGEGCRVVTEEVQTGLVPTLLAPLVRPALLRAHDDWIKALEKSASAL